MIKVLISACLLGRNVKYNGCSNYNEELIKKLKELDCILYPVCPEVMGGLKVPRDPCEIVNDKVISNKGKDCTFNYQKGAIEALKICLKEDIRIAILKANSPSCGNKMIYDGSFSSKLIKGMGVTSKLLSSNNIVVFNETEIDEILLKINDLKNSSK